LSERAPTFYAWLSLATAIVTIALKFAAYFLTGSVGLLSDAVEAVVNVVAALVALGVLTYSAAKPDREHNFGHEKAQYFSSGIEGALIFVAAGAIMWTAIPRLVNPQPIEQVGLGLVLSVAAALANAACAHVMLRAARNHRSITLEADARHLLTDVWTTAGVFAGVVLVQITGWLRLDPLIALAVAIQILWTGWHLMGRSFEGLMDRAIPEDDRAVITGVLDKLRHEGGDYHALRTREAGAKSFVDVHVLVPGRMSVQAGHDIVERLEAEIRTKLPHVEVLCHLEPLEDPRSWDDPEKPLAGH
jgi:cation diffusion facilitator family transporter